MCLILAEPLPERSLLDGEGVFLVGVLLPDLTIGDLLTTYLCRKYLFGNSGIGGLSIFGLFSSCEQRLLLIALDCT